MITYSVWTYKIKKKKLKLKYEAEKKLNWSIMVKTAIMVHAWRITENCLVTILQLIIRLCCWNSGSSQSEVMCNLVLRMSEHAWRCADVLVRAEGFALISPQCFERSPFLTNNGELSRLSQHKPGRYFLVFKTCYIQNIPTVTWSLYLLTGPASQSKYLFIFLFCTQLET